MSNPYVVAIHGMGQHTAESFSAEITKALDPASQQFADLPGKFSDSVNLHIIEYNTICEKVRNIVEESSPDKLNQLLGKLEGFPSFITRLTQIQNTLTNDDAFWKTHWLDVLTYNTIYSNAIQLHVAAQLLKVIKKANKDGQCIHIIAHSLGTKVIHDTLHKLFKNDFTQEERAKINYFPLNPQITQISSITMIANVSKMMPFGRDPYTSIVKVLPDGITHNFIDVRHALDPVPLLRPFNPPADWDDSLTSDFLSVRLHKVERLNVHDVDHYLADPKLYVPLLSKIFIFDYTEDELAKAVAIHHKTTIHGKYDQVVAAVKAINVDIEYDEEEKKLIYDGKDSLERFELALNQLMDFIKDLSR